MYFKGETSAGKTTLINLLVGKNMFVTSNIAATGRVCRIRHSKSMKIKIYSKDESLIDEETAGDLNGLKTLIKKYTVVERNPQEMVDVFLPVPILKVIYIQIFKWTLHDITSSVKLDNNC